MKLAQGTVWLGTEAAHLQYLAAVEAFEARSKSGDITDLLPPMMAVQDGVAVIPVRGPLVSGEAGFMRLFGVTGYGDVMNALNDAVASKASAIVLAIDSGGGMVNGVQDLADYITAVDAVKPVLSHTGGGMMSAALWLGLGARATYGVPTSEVGSVGAIYTHIERSEQMKKEGVKATLVRGGKFKALQNPYEPLSAVAKEQLQAKVDALHGMFLEHVGRRRGVSAEVARKTYGEGQTFLGVQASNLGLIDGTLNFDDVLLKAKSEVGKPVTVRRGVSKNSDSTKATSYTPAQSGTIDMKLNPQQLAALASGIALDQVLAMDTSVETQELTEEQKAAQAAEVAAQAEAAAAAAAEAEKAKDKTPPATTDAVAFLQGEVARVQDLLTASKLEVAQFKTENTTMKASHDGLLAIARMSVGRMQVALGATGAAAEALSASEILAEHARVTELFQKKYPVGGVAGVKPEDKPAEKLTASVHPMFLHAVKGAAK